jgi:hypothetical protein
VRAVPVQLAREINTKADKRVSSDSALPEPRRQTRQSLIYGIVSDELGGIVQSSETIQQVTDVCFVSSKMLPDGVSVNGKAHARLTV